MKQTVVTGYVFTAAAKTLDLGSISGFNIKRLYAVINIDANQIIYASGIPAFGLASLSGTVLTLVYNTTAMSDSDRLEIIYDTVNTDLANAWVTKLTDGTNSQSYTGAGEAKVSVTQPLPAGANNIGSITNITGTVSLPTNAAQETGGHLAALDAKFNSLGQKTSAASAPVVLASDQPAIPVTLTTTGIEIGKVDQGLTGTNAQAWWVQLGDTTRGPVPVKAASTAAAAGDLSLVVALSPNSPLPAGANVIGAVTQSAGPWTQNITQFGGTNLSTGTGASGLGIPRVTVANDSNILATQSGAWSTGRTWTLSSGTDSVSAVQSGTWNITNISGTISLPTGASTSANQTNGSQLAQAVDAAGRVITVKAASTAAIATDTSLVTAFSPNSPLPTGANVIGAVTQSGTWTVQQGGAPWSVSQSGTWNIGTVTAVTAITNALPAGANTIGAVTQASGPWTQNITQFGGSAVVTGTGASGAGIPRVTVANDSNILATQSGTWNITNISGTISLPTGASTEATLAKLTQTQGSTTSGQSGPLIQGAVTTAAPAYTTAQTSPLSLTTAGGLRTDMASAGGTAISTGTGASGAGIPRVTVANDSNILATQSGTWTVQQGGAPWSVSQSGTWNINNISGTISLPTGAATSANQTNASQKTQIVDGSGNVIASTAVSAVNYLNVLNPSEGATAAAVPARTTQIGGSDGTNLRTLVTDTTGNLNIVGNVASAATDSGNPIKIGGLAKTAQPTAVTDGQRVNGLHDKLGRQVVVSNHIRDLVTNSTTTITNSPTETTIVASVASTFNDLSSLVITNGTATQVTVTIRDATAGTVRGIFDLAPFGGMVFNPATPWKQTTVANNWTATLSVNTVTVHIFAIAIQNI